MWFWIAFTCPIAAAGSRFEESRARDFAVEAKRSRKPKSKCERKFILLNLTSLLPLLDCATQELASCL